MGLRGAITPGGRDSGPLMSKSRDSSSEVFLDLTDEEFEAARAAIGVATESDGKRVQRGRRSLATRGLLVPTGKRSRELVEPIGLLLETLERPGVLVRAVRSPSGETVARQYAATLALAVEHVRLEGGHRLTPFNPDEVLARALAFVQLTERGEVAEGEFEVGQDVLEAATQARAHEDSAGMAERLVAAGVDRGIALSFAEAANAADVSATIYITFRPEEDVFAGGELTWLDGGEAGIWLVEGASSGDESEERGSPAIVRVRTTTAEWIARELFSYLPSVR